MSNVDLAEEPPSHPSPVRLALQQDYIHITRGVELALSQDTKDWVNVQLKDYVGLKHDEFLPRY